MAFEKLSAQDQKIVLRCMRATAAHVEDWEKHSRLGLEPDELKVIIDQWPKIDDADESGNGFLAINNCLNESAMGFALNPMNGAIGSTHQKQISNPPIKHGSR
jgi:hypothetical protein